MSRSIRQGQSVGAVATREGRARVESAIFGQFDPVITSACVNLELLAAAPSILDPVHASTGIDRIERGVSSNVDIDVLVKPNRSERRSL